MKSYRFGIGNPEAISRNAEDNNAIINELFERLPHGSGINSDWYVDLTQRRVYAVNRFSAMDEMGGYCCDYRFSIEIPVKQGAPMWDQFVFKMLDNHAGCECAYGLSEYLEDTLAEVLQ